MDGVVERSRRHRSWSLAVAALLVLLAVAARPQEISASASTSFVSVSLTDFGIRLSTGTVGTGKVVFRVMNRGNVVHDFAIAGKRTAPLAHGKRQTIEIMVRRAGTYRFSSTLPGQAAVGMAGSLRVTRGRVPTARPLVTSSRLRLTRVAGDLGPLTHVVSPPGDPQRLLVVQQVGRVVLFKDGVQVERPFLDLRRVVGSGGEAGLLSLAFAPDYAQSGLFYVFFTNRDGHIRVFEFRRSASDPDVADVSTRRRVLAIAKQAANHNGGMLQFGPDGYLYMSVGDGGSNPPDLPIGRSGQSTSDLFATILRIDPRGGRPYAIPPDNPFVEIMGARPEIVAYGLRNPWRFWIDGPTRTMFIGDVGEGGREEVDRLPLARLGLNFGWPCREGTTTPSDVAAPASCAGATLAEPLFEYPNGGRRCSITGGVVARDPQVRALDGLFLWADFCEGVVRGLTARGALVPLGLTVERPSSFGVDALGRVHVVTVRGDLYRLELAGAARASR